MPLLGCNLSLMFTDRPLLARFEAARRAGFDAVEIQFPYDDPLDELAAARRAAGLPLVLINVPPGDRAAGEVGLACLPDRRDDFRRAVEDCRRRAAVLGVPAVNVLAGRRPPGLDRATALAVLADNLQLAAETLASDGIRVTVEPLNDQDTPGFLLTRGDETVALLDAIGHPGLSLQFDVYHAQIMEGDALAALRRDAPRIGHLQFADVPGRGAPGSGKLDFDALFGAIAALGLTCPVMAEYRSDTATEATLDWVGPARTRLAGG